VSQEATVIISILRSVYTLQLQLYNQLYTAGFMNTAGCTTSWMNCANEPSQAALERASQDVYDVIASRQGGCVETRQCGTFERMNIQNVLNSQLYNRQYECLHNWLYNRL